MGEDYLNHQREKAAVRHRRLFELLNQGELQVNSLTRTTRVPFVSSPAIEDFAEMARQSLALQDPPRRRFWQR